MERSDIRSVSHGCSSDILVICSRRRPLLISICLGCGTVWLTSSHTTAPFSLAEMRGLVHLRKRYLAGELTR